MARRPVHRDRQGFTLVEVLVTMMILAFGLMGSLVGVMAAMDNTLLNDMRGEAMKIAQEQMEEARNMSYASIQTISATQVVQRQFRKTLLKFTVNTTTTPLPGYAPYGMTKLSILVQWPFKSKTYSYLRESIVRQSR